MCTAKHCVLSWHSVLNMYHHLYFYHQILNTGYILPKQEILQGREGGREGGCLVNLYVQFRFCFLENCLEPSCICFLCHEKGQEEGRERIW